MTPLLLDDLLEVFFGDATCAVARIYVRLPQPPCAGECRLTGRVVGPVCEYSSTLSASVPLISKQSMGPTAPALLAEAVVPDPCFWSPDLPFMYQVEVELRGVSGGGLLAATQRQLGIRPLGAFRRRLLLAATPWVPRGIDAGEVAPTPLREWRAADALMVVDRPDEALCREASLEGVLLAAELAGTHEELAGELRRLARWPAVALAIVEAPPEAPRSPPSETPRSPPSETPRSPPSETPRSPPSETPCSPPSETPCSPPLEFSIRAAARNLLLAQRLELVSLDEAAEPGSWADLVVCDVSDPADVRQLLVASALPVIARRLAGWRDDLSQARAECDRLQCDLAGRGDFAGYFV